MPPATFPKRVLVTGGAGFIGSAVVRQLLENSQRSVLSFDKLCFRNSRLTEQTFRDQQHYSFVEGDITSPELLTNAFQQFQPEAVVHTAAQTSVDCSISDGTDCVQANLVGTFNLLEVSRTYWEQLPSDQKRTFRFLQISTDEVYGSLGQEGQFTELSPLRPRNPYSATKAGSDHFVSAWRITYGLPTLLARLSNNYGPFQQVEKLIPRMIVNALSRKPLPIYGDGSNIRDWLHVEDGAQAIRLILDEGRTGECYNVGGHSERSNLEVIRTLCSLLDELRPHTSGKHLDLMEFVSDRPGHDFRYALDSEKLRSELGWRPNVEFTRGLLETVHWYLENEDWWRGNAAE